MEPLDATQLRVLGVLIEKEATTPDQYPLTMNGLLNGCNQTSNRYPVTSYDQEDLEAVLASLRERNLVRVVHSPSNRAEKYRQVVGETWELGLGELAILAVLALRGPQTVNDLRTRTERYKGLEEMGGVEGLLHRLKNRYEEPYVTRLDRRPGQREERWAHLLAGAVDEDSASSETEVGESPRLAASARLSVLEAQVAALQQELGEVKATLEQLSALLE